MIARCAYTRNSRLKRSPAQPQPQAAGDYPAAGKRPKDEPQRHAPSGLGYAGVQVAVAPALAAVTTLIEQIYDSLDT